MVANNLYKRINIKQGAGCEISEFCSLENVILGDNVRIGDGVQLKNVVVGAGSKLGVNVRFYSPDSAQPVKIGKNCWLSYGVFGEATGGEIILDDQVVIAHRTVILTSSGPGKGNPVMGVLYPEQRGSIQVGKYSWFGTQCTVLPGSFFGEGAVLGAHSLAGGGTYEEWTVYGGVPAKVLKKFDPEKIAEAKRKTVEYE